MRFQVGTFTCEMSLDAHGGVQTRWFLANGRRTEPPKYLDAADRRQYRAGRDSFLGAAGKAPARLTTGSSWRALRRIAPAALVAAAVAGCARGGGIGLEAMIADLRCEQAGYEVGTPEYANCRMALYQQSGLNAAAMQAYYQRQQDWYWQQQNRQQTCIL